MTSRTPHILYRYRSFDLQTINSLCHDVLFFAHPSSFNDPLDCNPTIRSDSSLGTLRELFKHLLERRVAAETTNSFQEAQIRGKSAESYALNHAAKTAKQKLDEIAYNATDPEYEVSEEEAEMSLLTHQIREELLRHYERGVCCFSTVFNSALLWSHYGDEHRGICIGYDLKRIPRPTLHQVVYGGDRTIWTSALDAAFLQKDLRAIEAVDRDVLLRKAPGWRYEREWRLIGSKGVQDSCLRLSDVTFGLRCPEAVKHSVIRALDGREEVSFYEIYEQECTFRLSRRMVQIDELQSWFPRTARSGAEIFNEDITSQE